MIANIISILDAAAVPWMNIHERFGLVEMREVSGKMRPVHYLGGTDARSILEDNKGSVSYWRLLRPYSQTFADRNVYSVCSDGIKRTYQLRFAVFYDRSSDVCKDIAAALGNTGSAFMRAGDTIDAELDLLSVNVTPANTEMDTVQAGSSEMPGATIPIQKAMAYIDVTVVVQGESTCFDECAVIAAS